MLRRCLLLTALLLETVPAANVRVSHVAPTVSAVDVYLNRQRVFVNVPFNAVTSYLSLPNGQYDVTVYPSGDSSRPVLTALAVRLGDGHFTLAAIGSGPLKSYETTLFQDDLRRAGNLAQLRVIHADATAAALQADVFLRGLRVTRRLAYRQASVYAPVKPGETGVRVQFDDGSVQQLHYTLRPGKVYTVFLIGAGSDGAFQALLSDDTTATDDATGHLP